MPSSRVHLIVSVEMVFIGLVAELHTLEKLFRDVWISSGGDEGRIPIQAGENSILDRARLDVAWPADDARHAETALMNVPFDALNGVMPPSGQVNVSAPLSVEKTTMVLLASPMSSRVFKSAPTRRRVAPFRPPQDRNWSWRSSYSCMLRQKRPDVRARGVMPDEKRFAGGL